MTLAPLFCVCVAALALLWANQARLIRETSDDMPFPTGETIAFWLVIASSFVAITSAMLGMMSWFGSDVQEVLLNVHRAAAFILIVAAAYQAARLLARPVLRS